MCGIGGLLANLPDSDLRASALSMCTALAHRGPDGDGVFVGQGIALSHTRLSIIDLSDDGAQPMQTEDGRFVLTYNGELYNYRQLKQELLQAGVKFVSSSDSEVVLKAIVHWGTAALSRFNGMFALALWDTRDRQLLLARDRFGIKPLYYCRHKGQFGFASEIKALSAIGIVDQTVSAQGLGEYLYYGHTHGSHTLYQSCHKLEAGAWLRIREGREPESGHFWALGDIPANQDSPDSVIANVGELLADSVKRQLMADVPVGVFLSGGLDSSTLCALGSEHYAGQLKTYSVDFQGSTAHSELALAREVALAAGTEHNELHVGFDNLPSLIEAMSDAHDQPFGDAANIPLYLLTRQLGGDIKVVLQGDGGDEIFGGYSRYRLLQRRLFWKMLKAMDVLPESWLYNIAPVRRLRRMAQALGESDGAMRGARLLSEECFDSEVTGLLSKDSQALFQQVDPFQRYRDIWRQVADQDPAQAMLWTDTRILLTDQFLEKVDRSTMANGIEVRVPFLDNELTDYVMGVPAELKLAGQSKSLLRSAMKNKLPQSVLHGRKYGFGVPYAEWLRGPLSAFTREHLLAPDGIVRQLYDERTLTNMCDQHASGQGHRGFMLYKLLMLSVWANRSGVNL